MEVSDVTYSIYCHVGKEHPILWLSIERGDVDSVIYGVTEVDGDALSLPTYDLSLIHI